MVGGEMAMAEAPAARGVWLCIVVSLLWAVVGCERIERLFDSEACDTDDDCASFEVCPEDTRRCEDATGYEKRAAADEARAEWKGIEPDSIEVRVVGTGDESSHRLVFGADDSVDYACVRRCPREVTVVGRLPKGGFATWTSTLFSNDFFALSTTPEKLSAGARRTEISVRAEGGKEKTVAYNLLPEGLSWLDSSFQKAVKSADWKGGTPALLAGASFSAKEKAQSDKIRNVLVELGETSKCKHGPRPTWSWDVPPPHKRVTLRVSIADEMVSKAEYLDVEEPNSHQKCMIGELMGRRVGHLSVVPATLDIPCEQ